MSARLDSRFISEKVPEIVTGIQDKFKDGKMSPAEAIFELELVTLFAYIAKIDIIAKSGDTMSAARLYREVAEEKMPDFEQVHQVLLHGNSYATKFGVAKNALDFIGRSCRTSYEEVFA